jgi:hypothetical protein
MLFTYPHKLSNKGLQVEDNLSAIPNPMFIKRTPLHYIRLQRIIDKWNQLECQRLEDCGRWNAMCEEIIEFRSDLENLGRCVLGVYVCGDGTDECFPIGGWDGC